MLGGLLSLPGLAPALLLERSVEPAIAAEAARIYVFDRLPHHLAPLSLPADELQTRLARFGAITAVMLALWAWASRRWKASEESAQVGAAFVNWPALARMLRYAGFALAANCAGLAIEAALDDAPITAARILRYYWFRQADVAVPLATAIAGTCLVFILLGRQTAAAITAALLPLAACGWFLLTTAMARLNDPTPPALAKLEAAASWLDACRWISRHTSPDARLLIPRAGHSFKWYASRADVASYKDVPQDAASVVEWRRRMEELFPKVERHGKLITLDSPEKLGAQRVREVARRYGASHVIARSYPPLDLPVAYPVSGDRGDSFYTVYETGASTSAPSR
jgi:hypothetical protein